MEYTHVFNSLRSLFNDTTNKIMIAGYGITIHNIKSGPNYRSRASSILMTVLFRKIKAFPILYLFPRTKEAAG